MKNFVDLYNNSTDMVFELLKKEPWNTRSSDFGIDWVEFVQMMLHCSPEEFLDLLSSVSDDVSGLLDEIITEQFYEKEFDNEDDNIITQYIKRFNYRMTRESIELLTSIRRLNYSVFEIKEISDDKTYLIMQDILLRTKPLKVELDLCSTYEKGDFVYTKVISLKGKNYLSGLNLLFPMDEKGKTLKSVIRRTLSRAKINLAEYEVVPDDMYREVKQIMKQYQQLLFTHAFEFCIDINFIGHSMGEMKYKIMNKDKMIEILNSMEDDNIIKIEENEWDWVEMLDGELNDLVNLEIDGDYLLCTTINKDNLRQLNSFLKPKLGNTVGFALFENKDFDEEF